MKAKNLVKAQASAWYPLQKLILTISVKTAKISGLIQFCLIFLLLAKYFVTDRSNSFDALFQKFNGNKLFMSVLLTRTDLLGLYYFF